MVSSSSSLPPAVADRESPHRAGVGLCRRPGSTGTRATPYCASRITLWSIGRPGPIGGRWYGSAASTAAQEDRWRSGTARSTPACRRPGRIRSWTGTGYAVRAAAVRHPHLPRSRRAALLDDEESAHHAAANAAPDPYTVRRLLRTDGRWAEPPV
ncbi:hypothetical protein ACIQRW_31455 [Streptomyces sp. NPDC091287]|uniref:hypothetical protein n=1 Tax=Streptomyces sp. NPDC091287 TaxID=3365988 RepID=UPI0038084B04